MIHADLKFQKDHKSEIYCALSVVGGATAYHVARLVRIREVSLLLDVCLSSGSRLRSCTTKFEAGFIAVLEQYSTAFKVIGSSA